MKGMKDGQLQRQMIEKAPAFEIGAKVRSSAPRSVSCFPVRHDRASMPPESFMPLRSLHALHVPCSQETQSNIGVLLMGADARPTIAITPPGCGPCSPRRVTPRG